MSQENKQLFSNYYRDQQKKLHEKEISYGRGPRLRLARVIKFLEEEKVANFIDYGCGKAMLRNLIMQSVWPYDPMVEEFSREPPQADYLVCVDVLEHIEPELLDNVLEHIQSKFKKKALFYISWAVGSAFLPDGRDAHLILEDHHWWLQRLEKYFWIESMEMKPVHSMRPPSASTPKGAYFVVRHLIDETT